MAREPFIVCDGLVKIYKIAELEVVALQGLDLVVSKGEMLGVVGVSGSGKTTLMNTLGGLDRPSAGRVWVDGNDLLKMSDGDLDYYRRSTVGFVWQQVARNLIPFISAVDNVKLPMTLSGRGNRNKRRAEELLEAVGLADRRNHRLSELSGGEQQRIAIAVALANEPTMLLADEPTGEVDEETAVVIYEMLKKLNREMGLTTLIVSHDPGLAHHVDRVAAIRDGKTAAETVRQTANLAGADDNLAAEENQQEVRFEELTVLDSAGRLQVPKEYLEQFGIRRRVRLDVAEDGILIRPVSHADEGQSAESLATEMTEAKKDSRLRQLLKRWQQRDDDEGKNDG
jgi:ABC-type lipoprotein export system ATPase subunit/bifunctional DNA-binding transcriptional regulator/antitoxin component of YhaV-PrlF toxin-antitoxin module